MRLWTIGILLFEYQVDIVNNRKNQTKNFILIFQIEHEKTYTAILLLEKFFPTYLHRFVYYIRNGRAMLNIFTKTPEAS